VQSRNETSAGGVTVRPNGGAFDVVIIKTHEGRWQLPKGWVEEGEEPAQAAVREVREEGGIESEVVAPLDTIRYQYIARFEAEPARIYKRVHFFLVRYVSGDPADHDDEVQEARWVPLEEALRLLTFKDERRMVELARDRLDALHVTSPQDQSAKS
jgi:8-oxo-dGTP pyrophosphatase MutT (NUDIX family)